MTREELIDGWKAIAAYVEAALARRGYPFPFSVDMAREQAPVDRITGPKPRVFSTAQRLDDFAAAYIARRQTWQGASPVEKGDDAEGTE